MNWIDVRIKEPDVKLFLGYGPEIGIHCFKNDEDQCVTGGWESCYYCGGQSIGLIPSQGECENHKERISHWMPLPPEPIKDS